MLNSRKREPKRLNDTANVRRVRLCKEQGRALLKDEMDNKIGIKINIPFFNNLSISLYIEIPSLQNLRCCLTHNDQNNPLQFPGFQPFFGNFINLKY